MTATVTKGTMIGVDLAKNTFQFHGATMNGHVKFRRKLARGQFLSFMAAQAPAIVVMEACGGAHHWARELSALGHEVRLIAPIYVKPLVKRQKNDAADAEAIVEAVQRPEMRFVEPKSVDQQARALPFRTQEQLVHQRTELMNALRSYLYEYGHVLPIGIASLRRIEAIVEATDNDLPELVRDICRDLLQQIAEKTARIDALMKRIKSTADDTETARRLQTMPGVAPVTTLAIEAFAPPLQSFRCGRDFAAWLGLVPHRNSTGGKQRLGRVTKAGQADIRRLLILGAMSRLTWLGRKSIREGSWLARMLERKPKMLVAIALANKMARAIRAMLTRGEDYRNPVPVAVA